MNMRWISLFGLAGCLALGSAQATIRLERFENRSTIPFREQFEDGTPYREMLDNGECVVIDREGAVIESEDGLYRIVLEDAYRSGYHRPHWKFHVWLESREGFPFLAEKRLLYAVFFYDGEGVMRLGLDGQGRLHVEGGRDVLYPWKQGKIGRGTPYHSIDHNARGDGNGVVYFDGQGFVAYPFVAYVDPVDEELVGCGEGRVCGRPRYLGPPEHQEG